MKNSYLLLILILLFTACKSDDKKNNISFDENDKSEAQAMIKSNDTKATESKVILIGSGGGFTGSNSEYQIFPHGAVKKIISPNQDTIKMKNIDAKTLGTIFEDFEKLQIDQHRFNKPGNMTMYIGYKKANKIHMVKWGDNTFDPPDDYIDFYNFLMQDVLN